MALSFEGVSLALSGRPVLSAVNLGFAPGRVTVILGPNGAGKSSLLRAAAGLVRPGSGRILVDGRDLATIPPRERARAIGYLPQDGTAHWNLPARDLIALGRLPHRATAAEDESAIAAAIVATASEALAERPVRELSGGERARVLLARVLAGQPRWLLADEPLASLDPLHQIEALDRLRAVARGGTGVLLVLHDLTQAARIADEAVLLARGAVLAAGPREAVLTGDRLAAAFGVRISMARGEDGLPIIVPIGRA